MTKVEAFCNLIKGRKSTRTTTAERRPKRIGLSSERRQHLQTTRIPKNIGEFDHQREKEARQNHSKLKSYQSLEKFPDHVSGYFSNLYDSINKALRDGDMDALRHDVFEIEDEYGEPAGDMTLEEITHDITNYMSPLKENLTVYRGIGNVEIPEDAEKIPMPSFTSTSTNISMAGVFSTKGGTIFAFDLPKGTHALVTNDDEQEVLLPPGNRLVIKDRIKRDDGMTVLFCAYE